MRHVAVAALLGLLPNMGLAESAMTGPEFQAYVGTRTISYDYGGGQTGTEEYLPNRRVRWMFDGDTCMLGSWYDQGDQICFVYEYDPAPQCWQFFREASGLKGRYLGEGGGWEIHEIAQSDVPLPCAGPNVGV